MMRNSLIVVDAIRGLITQPLRSMISVVAMMFAMLCLFVLVNLNFAANEKVKETLAAIGPNILCTWVMQPYDTKYAITPNNVSKLIDSHHRLSIHPFHYNRKPVSSRGPEVYASWVQTDLSLIDDLSLTLYKGFYFIKENHPQGVSIGYDLAKQLNLDVFDTLWMDHKGYKILNILNKVPINPLLDFNINESVFVPIDYAGASMMRLEDFIVFYPNDISSDQAKSLFEHLVSQMYDEFKIHFRNQDLLTEHIRKSISSYQSVFTWVCVLAITMSFIGIISQQTMAFLERRGECGMRLSLGASRRELFTLFLVESLLLGSIGAALGLIGGGFSLYFVLKSLQWPFGIHYLYSMTAYFGCIILAMISGILPAAIAAKYQPYKLLAYQ